MVGMFGDDSPYSSGYMKEELTTVDKMSTVVIEYLGYSKVLLKHKRR